MVNQSLPGRILRRVPATFSPCGTVAQRSRKGEKGDLCWVAIAIPVGSGGAQSSKKKAAARTAALQYPDFRCAYLSVPGGLTAATLALEPPSTSARRAVGFGIFGVAATEP